jgi:hypothetical protein
MSYYFTKRFPMATANLKAGLSIRLTTALIVSLMGIDCGQWLSHFLQ